MDKYPEWYQVFYDDVLLFAAKAQAVFGRRGARRTAKEIDQLRADVLGTDDAKRQEALEHLREARPAKRSNADGVGDFLIMLDMTLPTVALKPIDEGPTELAKTGWILQEAGYAEELVESALEQLLQGTGEGDLSEFWEFDGSHPEPRPPGVSHLRVVDSSGDQPDS